MGSPEWKLMVDLDGTNAQGRRRAHKHGNSLGASRSCPDLTANGFQIDYGTPLEADNQAQRVRRTLERCKSPPPFLVDSLLGYSAMQKMHFGNVKDFGVRCMDGL